MIKYNQQARNDARMQLHYRNGSVSNPEPVALSKEKYPNSRYRSRLLLCKCLI